MFARLRKAFAIFDKWATRFSTALGILLLVAINVSVVRVWFCQVQSAYYPTTEGVVLNHKEVKHSKYTERIIEYEYEANGARWICSRWWYTGFGELFPTVINADKQVAAQFPVGARVPVSYNPADPADAVLLPGLSGADIFSAWIAGLVTVFTIFAPKQWTEPPAPVRTAPRWVRKRFGWRVVVTAQARRDLAVLCVWLLISCTLSFAFVQSGSSAILTVWEAVGVVAATAGVVWFRWRCAAKLTDRFDIYTKRQQLRWRVGDLFEWSFRLPFEAITNIRAREFPMPDGTPTHRVEVEWYTSRHRTLTRMIPLTLNSVGDAEELAARLRELVFGAAGPPQLPPNERTAV
jgi:hypothetical protein